MYEYERTRACAITVHTTTTKLRKDLSPPTCAAGKETLRDEHSSSSSSSRSRRRRRSSSRSRSYGGDGSGGVSIWVRLKARDANSVLRAAYQANKKETSERTNERTTEKQRWRDGISTMVRVEWTHSCVVACVRIRKRKTRKGQKDKAHESREGSASIHSFIRIRFALLLL